MAAEKPDHDENGENDGTQGEKRRLRTAMTFCPPTRRSMDGWLGACWQQGMLGDTIMMVNGHDDKEGDNDDYDDGDDVDGDNDHYDDDDDDDNFE